MKHPGFFKTLRKASYYYLIHKPLSLVLPNKFRKKSFDEMFPELANRQHLFNFLTRQVSSNLEQKPYESYRATSWVYAAIARWQRAISTLNLWVVDEQGTRIRNEEIERIFSFSDTDFTPAEIHNRWCLDLGLRGEVFWQFEPRRFNNRSYLQPISPDSVKVRIARGKPEVFYRVHSYQIEHALMEGGYEVYDLPKSQIIHWKFFNPLQPYRGMAPLSAVRHGVVNDQLAVAWQYYFFKNQARPDWFLVAPSGLTKTEKDSYYEKIHDRFGLTSENWGIGEPMILEEGITDVKTVSFPPKDLAWIEQREMNRVEIAGVFGVPPELMGFGKNTFENYNFAEQFFWANTVVSLIEFRDDRLTHFFRAAGLIDADQSIKTDLSRVIPLRRTLAPMFRQAESFFSMGAPFNKINEYFGFGFPEFQGDDISHPFGTPLSFASTGEVIDETEETKGERNGRTSRFKERV